MSDGAINEHPTEDNVHLTSIERLVQANRDYYHSWRALWASDDKVLVEPISGHENKLGIAIGKGEAA